MTAKTVKHAKKTLPAGMTPWQKGQSGNPKGRPPVTMALAQIVRDVGAEIDPESKRSRIEEVVRGMYIQAKRDASCAKFIAERGWGNVPIELSADVAEYTPEQLEEVRKKRWASVAPYIGAALKEESDAG